MKERFNLASYSVQEITIAEAQKINGGLAGFWVSGVRTVMTIGAAASAVWDVVSFSSERETQYMKGRCSAGCVC